MLVKLRFLIVFLFLAGSAFSQYITGYFDGYYLFNFNKPDSRTNGIRAFDINHSQFSLNYAELVIDKKPAPLGFRADIGFGDASKIVHAAVSMVESALKSLAEREIVELDSERKAAMVSNLLVVLCSDKETQPIINAGTLYN